METLTKNTVTLELTKPEGSAQAMVYMLNVETEQKYDGFKMTHNMIFVSIEDANRHLDHILDGNSAYGKIEHVTLASRRENKTAYVLCDTQEEYLNITIGVKHLF